jgi:hypothetical protein
VHAQEMEKLTSKHQEKISLSEQQKHRILELGNKVQRLEVDLKERSKEPMHWKL